MEHNMRCPQIMHGNSTAKNGPIFNIKITVSLIIDQISFMDIKNRKFKPEVCLWLTHDLYFYQIGS